MTTTPDPADVETAQMVLTDPGLVEAGAQFCGMSPARFVAGVRTVYGLTPQP